MMGEGEEEVPLKLIELSDFLRSPSILSEKLQFKQTSLDKSSADRVPSKPDVQSIEKQSGVVLLKSKSIFNNKHRPDEGVKEKELIVPKDVIIFADDLDRKKLGLLKKSTNHFSRHLLITSGAALQALIAPLTNASEWLIICKLKHSKCYTKETAIQGNVVLSLNIHHPLVRYEILTAFDLLQQSFNQIKSAYIVIDFSQLLKQWFKTYLKRCDRYPSLSNRLLYRYRMQTSKCSITLGQRQFHQQEYSHRIRKSDIPMEIYINFSSLPTSIYSIQLNNIFIYSMNDQFKEILKDMGDGLSLVSIQNFSVPNNCTALVKKEEIAIPQEKILLEQRDEGEAAEDSSCSYSSYEPTNQEKLLFEKIFENRIRIQRQHQQLMIKAAQLLCSVSQNNDTLSSSNTQAQLQSIKIGRY